MSASLSSGTYGRQPAFTTALRQLMAGLFSTQPAIRSTPSTFAYHSRARVREANDVRELARSVESHSPGFAADLYAAALRHEGLAD